MITDQPDDMPVFVLKAKDKLALSTVWAYYTLCENAGLDGQAAQVALAVDEIREWQRRNPDRLQLPDHPHVPVEGSTPIASPAAPEACCVDTEQGPDAHGTLLHTLGCRNRCGVDTTWYPPTSPLQGAPYPCGTTLGHEGDHWAPPALRTPMVAAEPAPVPPPVDALEKILNLVEEVALARVKAFNAANRDDGPRAAQHGDRAKALRLAIAVAVEDVRASGVAEGRRQRDAEIHASVFTSARLAAAEAGFGPAPESVTVSYERRATAYEEGIYDAGITEGRRLLDETAATAAVHAYELGIAEGRRQAAHAITEETATFCMDGVGRHLVEVCTKLAAGPDHG